MRNQTPDPEDPSNDLPARALADRLALAAHAKDGVVRVTRRVPRGLPLSDIAVAGVGFALLAAGPEHVVAYVAWCFGAAWYTGLHAHARARRAAAAAVVAPMRRELEIAPATGGGHRDAAAKTLRLDGRELPLSSLKRVSVERLLVRTATPDGAGEAPRGARVILIFERHAVVVERASSVEGAVALAAEIAAAAGIAHDFAPDRVDEVAVSPEFDRPWHRGRLLTAGIDLSDARDEAHAELPFRREAPFALLRLGVVLGAVIGVIAAASHPLAEHPRWRWAVAAALAALSMGVDVAVVRVGARLFRDPVREALRHRYGIGST